GGQVPLPGLLIVLATNHEPPRPGMPPPGPGSAPPRPRRPRFGGLPTSLGAAPPARMSSPLPRARPSAPPSAERYSSTTLSPPQTAPATPPPSTAFSPTAHASAPLAEPVARPAVQPLSPPEPVAEPQPAPPVEVGPEESRLPSPSPDEQPAASSVEPVEEAPSGPGWTEQLGAAASSAFAQARRFLVQMLPDRQVVEEQPDYSALTPGLEVETEAAESPPSRARHLETAIELETPVRAPSPAVPAEQEQARAGMDEPAVMPTPVLDLPPFTPPQPARGARARLFLLLALVIALLVPAVVAATYLIEGYDREAQAAQLTDAAEAQLVAAQAALDMGDKAAARQQLTEAQDFLNQAIELAGLTERRSQLLAAIETELQQVLQVVLLYGLTEPLITFPPEARPQRILVEGEDIFVLDTGRQAVYQYRVDAATGLVADQAGLVVLQQDHVVDGVPVGSLADMAWLPLIPGYEDRPSLLIADRNNNIFRYDQRVEGATLLPLAGQNRWVSIGQIETYETRIYIADEGGGALYRYEGGQYNVPAENWFSPGTQVNLTGMISLAIDGDVWFLVNNGMILRYRTGEQVPFSPENSIGLAEEPVDLYVGRKELENIYLVDAGEDRILVYDKNGAYLSQLVAPERDLLRGLSAMTIDEVSGTMYLLTQGGVFTHPVVQ
ncbi:MAG TPA: hypothetical protein VNK95_20355, partial [Caldilineaceae bacterium]|nr:hypothetical protein [Caldilineaceae bacterium]